MKAYPIKVTAESSMDFVVNKFPEMTEAIKKGVRFLEPPSQAPEVNVTKNRSHVNQAPSLAPRRPSL